MNRMWAVIILVCSVTLSWSQIPSDREGLLNGEGMGQAMYAEMNGFPGPKHVLDLADTLKLTPAQREAVQEFFDEMKGKSRELGKKIVELEEQLISKFQSGIQSETEIATLSEHLGTLRGQLRSLHLIAHLKTRRVLTEEQIILYKKLRGLNDAPQHHHR
jgi:Spy/CpxP family protein refolding chaperone